jgi:serine/threonine-protein kinase RsbW
MHWFNKLDDNGKPNADFTLTAGARRRDVHRSPEIADVLDSLGTWMKFHAYSKRDLFAVTLALHEAATNALCHGNRGDESKRVRIDYVVLANEVLVRVEDEGNGFDPASVPDPYRQENYEQPCGRGLMLIRAHSTWVCYDPPGNRVTFARRRTVS